MDWSTRARNLYAAGDDILLQLLDARTHAVRNHRLVVIVVNVSDPLFLEAERVDAALEAVLLDSGNRIVRGVVHALQHRSENVTRRFRPLIGIHSDCKLAGDARRLEYSLARSAGNVIDDVHSLLI